MKTRYTIRVWKDSAAPIIPAHIQTITLGHAANEAALQRRFIEAGYTGLQLISSSRIRSGGAR